jgi:hypothetical protein
VRWEKVRRKMGGEREREREREREKREGEREREREREDKLQAYSQGCLSVCIIKK